MIICKNKLYLWREKVDKGKKIKPTIFRKLSNTHYGNPFNSLKKLGFKNSILSVFGRAYNSYFAFTYKLNIYPHKNKLLERKKGLTNQQTIHASRYDDSSLLFLRTLFFYLEPCTDEILLDVGCGKGIVLLAALESSFKEIRGFDHSEYLCDIANDNCKKYQAKKEYSKSVTVTVESALNYKFQDDETILYFNNPFDEHLSEKYLDLLKESLLRNNRKIRLISRAWQGEKIVSEKLDIASIESHTFWGRKVVIFKI